MRITMAPSLLTLGQGQGHSDFEALYLVKEGIRSYRTIKH